MIGDRARPECGRIETGDAHASFDQRSRFGLAAQLLDDDEARAATFLRQHGCGEQIVETRRSVEAKLHAVHDEDEAELRTHLLLADAGRAQPFGTRALE